MTVEVTILDEDGNETILKGEQMTENLPVVVKGKFPSLQEQLKQQLNAAHQRCVEAGRVIQRAAEERAELWEKMADVSKNALKDDVTTFNKFES